MSKKHPDTLLAKTMHKGTPYHYSELLCLRHVFVLVLEPGYLVHLVRFRHELDQLFHGLEVKVRLVNLDDPELDVLIRHSQQTKNDRCK